MTTDGLCDLPVLDGARCTLRAGHAGRDHRIVVRGKVLIVRLVSTQEWRIGEWVEVL